MSFTFFFKEKPIIIDAFTKYSNVYEYASIKEANNFIPEWWKNMNSLYEETNQYGIKTKKSTIKRCDGFIENYKNGFMIPAWSDFSILATDANWSYQFSDGISSIVSHPNKQFSDIFEDYLHFKIISPWMIREKTGIKFAFTNPIWNNVDKSQILIFPQGIVEYKYQHATNINIFIKKTPIQNEFTFGTPLAHIIPLSEKQVKIRNHLISDEEYRQLDDLHVNITFLNKYRKIINTKGSSTACPFNHPKY